MWQEKINGRNCQSLTLSLRVDPLPPRPPWPVTPGSERNRGGNPAGNRAGNRWPLSTTDLIGRSLFMWCHPRQAIDLLPPPWNVKTEQAHTQTQGCTPKHTHGCTNIYTQKHTYMVMYTHTKYVYTWPHKQGCTHIHTHTVMHTHTHIENKPTQACIYGHTHKNMC